MDAIKSLKEIHQAGPIKTVDQHTHSGFNKMLAVWITNVVGTMWTAYLFTILALISLPAVLTAGGFVSAHFFPGWIVAVGLIALVAWVAQTFFQLVLLPVILVGQNVQNATSDAQSEADHKILGHEADILDSLHEMQKVQTEILKLLDPRKQENRINEPADSVHARDYSNDPKPASA